MGMRVLLFFSRKNVKKAQNKRTFVEEGAFWMWLNVFCEF